MRILSITRTMALRTTTIQLLQSKRHFYIQSFYKCYVLEKLAHLPHLRHRHHANRGHVPSSSDFDTANAIEVRKYLKTYGLTPPGVDTFEKQEQRCEHIPQQLRVC